MNRSFTPFEATKHMARLALVGLLPAGCAAVPSQPPSPVLVGGAHYIGPGFPAGCRSGEQPHGQLYDERNKQWFQVCISGRYNAQQLGDLTMVPVKGYNGYADVYSSVSYSSPESASSRLKAWIPALVLGNGIAGYTEP